INAEIRCDSIWITAFFCSKSFKMTLTIPEFKPITLRINHNPGILLTQFFLGAVHFYNALSCKTLFVI
ncbi:hypothetical protein, partial [Pantoea ananatis]|uniref:hypothetical protein n=1 Tax=Pantoea ananas TaxID=553 RepID=UPI001B30CF75